MSITDISLNYFPAELVPQAWWENMLSNSLNIEEKKRMIQEEIIYLKRYLKQIKLLLILIYQQIL